MQTISAERPDGAHTMVSVGSAVRAVAEADGTMRVGGYLVPFTDENNKDLYDTFWTDESYLGARSGDGQDAFVHHTFPLDPKQPELVALSERRLAPLTTRVDKGVGLWAETVLNLSDEYEAAIAEMVRQGRLSWSSATAEHLMRVEPNGWVRSWPIIEGSLTPTPGTPFGRTKITTLRALLDAAIPPAPMNTISHTSSGAVYARSESTGTAGIFVRDNGTGPAGITITGNTYTEPVRALTGSPSEIIWTCYQCCLACAAVCRSCAEMCTDTAAKSAMYALAGLCQSMAASCLECWYAASGWTVAEDLVALCLAACARCCETCAECCDWCAAHATDTASADLCRACAAMCRMCVEACNGGDAMAMRAAYDTLPESVRAGAVLSAKNYALVETIAEAANTLLAAATKEKPADEARSIDVEAPSVAADASETAEAATDTPEPGTPATGDSAPDLTAVFDAIASVTEANERFADEVRFAPANRPRRFRIHLTR